MAGRNEAGLRDPGFDQPGRWRADLKRSVRLFKAFRQEQREPDRYYRVLSSDSLAQLGEHAQVMGAKVLDVGGGIGHMTEALSEAGASSVLLELHSGLVGTDRHPFRPASVALSFQAGRLAQGRAVGGDATTLPFGDGVFDITFSSNVLEHLRDPEACMREMVRVTRPGGTIYLAFTPWYSPWGGHETSPWHYFGGERAARRFEHKRGVAPINRFGSSLFPLHVGTVLGLARRLPDVTVLVAVPRYYPSWSRALVRVPGLREFATWNLLLILRRR